MFYVDGGGWRGAKQKCVPESEGETGSAAGGEARVIRVIKILRILRVARILKLVKFVT